MVSLPRVQPPSLCSMNSAIFWILQGQLLFVLWQLLWIHHISCRVARDFSLFSLNFAIFFITFGFITFRAGWREIFLSFHWTLQYFLLQSQLLPPRPKRGSHNQSSGRDGFYICDFWSIKILLTRSSMKKKVLTSKLHFFRKCNKTQKCKFSRAKFWKKHIFSIFENRKAYF